MLPNFFSILSGIFVALFSPLIQHVTVLYGQFDPVLDGPASIGELADFRRKRVETDRSKHRFFRYVWCFFVFNMLDNGYVLAQGDFDYFRRRMPELLYHKMFPERFWPQSDLIVLSIVLCSLVVYFCLWRGEWLDDRYTMYFIGRRERSNSNQLKLIVNNQVWNRQNGEKIYAFREANRRARKVCMVLSYFFFQPYFQYHYWSKWERSPRHAFLSVYLSILLCYTVFSIILLLYHFFIASKYIMIKQAFLLGRLRQLTETLRTGRSKTSFSALYRNFVAVNQLLAYQCSEIRAFNRFWSIYLSAQFASNIFCIGYLAYCYAFIPAAFDQKVYYVFAGAELSGLVFSVIYRCSVIDANNDRAYEGNVRVCTLFQLHYRMRLQVKAHIETIATNQSFSRSCFRLKNNYRLDSTAFNMAVFIVTTFFMSITKQARHYERFSHTRLVL